MAAELSVIEDQDRILALQLAYDLDDDDVDFNRLLEAAAASEAGNLTIPDTQIPVVPEQTVLAQGSNYTSRNAPSARPPGASASTYMRDDHYAAAGIDTFYTSWSARGILRPPVPPSEPCESKETYPLHIGYQFLNRSIRTLSPDRSPQDTGLARANAAHDPCKPSLLLTLLPPELLLCIQDQLSFPDAFAFSLTCKAVHAATASTLPLNRAAYLAKLKTWHEKQVGRIFYERRFCTVCLYFLPDSYFVAATSRNPGLSPSAEHAMRRRRRRRREAAPREDRICNDCLEFRKRMEASADGGKAAAVHPVWRRSTRAEVEGYGGLLWFRDRE